MKIRFNVAALILAAQFFQALPAEAVPTLYPETFNRQLRNNTNSNIVADSQDAARYYVLPPHKSAATVQNLHTITANVGFCQEIANLQRYNADTLAVLNSMKTKNLQTQLKIDEQNSNLKKAQDDLEAFVKVRKAAPLADLALQIRQTRQQLDRLYNSLKTCNDNCRDVSRTIEQTRQKLEALASQRWLLSSADANLAREFDTREMQIEKMEESIEEMSQDWRSIQNDLRELYSDFNRMFDAHAQREGGRVSINYNSHWSENVERLQRENPTLRFEKMPTKNAVLKASAYAKNNLLPGGAVLAFDVGGQSASAQLPLESFPESFSGNAVLNLLAVCPLLHPDWFAIPGTAAGPQQMAYPLTVSYEYPASMNYEVTASYNMYRMYELIKTQGRSGGFFTSKSWSKLEEEQYFKDAFRVDWKVQDERKLFSEEQKLNINTDLRRQIMSRLANFLIMNDSGTKLAAPEDAPATGAMVLSNSLNKACPLNVNCQGASIVFNVMQAIFGSSSTMQNLSRITNVTMSDTYRSEQVVLQPMLSSFQ